MSLVVNGRTLVQPRNKLVTAGIAQVLRRSAGIRVRRLCEGVIGFDLEAPCKWMPQRQGRCLVPGVA